MGVGAALSVPPSACPWPQWAKCPGLFLLCLLALLLLGYFSAVAGTMLLCLLHLLLLEASGTQAELLFSQAKGW